ncbi:hypothetical protein MKK67_02780 [Methylobacterium sp. J-072]|uniref:hypothetical protein n=1 Tax=Methylobacterium sp. J-072 TaxID=2836651 RepID=UPI001FB918FA|nr:hypothetical protein [Methylobacterium sp. J-072]MCJ2091438.1 hypothetical protein [Methylobacterium sp. J-072]
MWPTFLAWLRDNQIGDLTGVIGLAISLFGFAATLVGVYKSKTAAERAEQAARSTRESIRFFETVVDFSGVIAMLEDIKRGHRQEQWLLLLDRYAAIRKVLVTLRAANVDLSADQQSVIQSALANISIIERDVEAGLNDPSSLQSAHFNQIVSQDIDRLLTVLVEIKSAQTGDRL